MFTLFRVMSGAQSDAEAAALDSIMDDIPTFKFVFWLQEGDRKKP